VPKITKSERTRAAIMNAALDFVWTRPYRDLTVAELMTSAGMGRSVFYRYFTDLPEVMEALLDMLQGEIFEVAEPWLTGVGDPVALLQETLVGLVQVCYERGPFLRALTDAAADNERLAGVWKQFLGGFDDATVARIEADQKQDLIPEFDASSIAFALTRLDAYTLIQAFGEHPRSRPEPVREALARIWVSTLYGSEWVGREASTLIRRTNNEEA
jgi:AcrR family transcriptional regulator